MNLAPALTEETVLFLVTGSSPHPGRIHVRDGECLTRCACGLSTVNMKEPDFHAHAAVLFCYGCEGHLRHTGDRDLVVGLLDSKRAAARDAWQATQAARDAMLGDQIRKQLAEADESHPAMELRWFMGYLSELCYSAGWRMGLERLLWVFLHDHSANLTFPPLMAKGVRDQLRHYQTRAGGWWVFDTYALPRPTTKFVTDTEWRRAMEP